MRCNECNKIINPMCDLAYIDEKKKTIKCLSCGDKENERKNQKISVIYR